MELMKKVEDVEIYCTCCGDTTHIDADEAHEITMRELQYMWKPMDLAPTDGRPFYALYLGEEWGMVETRYDKEVQDFVCVGHPVDKKALPICWKTVDEYYFHLEMQDKRHKEGLKKQLY